MGFQPLDNSETGTTKTEMLRTYVNREYTQTLHNITSTIQKITYIAGVLKYATIAKQIRQQINNITYPLGERQEPKSINSEHSSCLKPLTGGLPNFNCTIKVVVEPLQTMGF